MSPVNVLDVPGPYKVPEGRVRGSRRQARELQLATKRILYKSGLCHMRMAIADWVHLRNAGPLCRISALMTEVVVNHPA